MGRGEVVEAVGGGGAGLLVPLEGRAGSKESGEREEELGVVESKVGEADKAVKA